MNLLEFSLAVLCAILGLLLIAQWRMKRRWRDVALRAVKVMEEATASAGIASGIAQKAVEEAAIAQGITERALDHVKNVADWLDKAADHADRDYGDEKHVH